MSNNESNLQTEQNGQPSTKVPGKAMEGEGMGGHQFGEIGKSTPMGDDKDNPSRNAGYSNGYFARTAPSDEDTANNNFKAAGQEGEPDYDSAHGNTNIPGPREEADQLKVGEPEENTSGQPDSEKSPNQTNNPEDHIET